MVLSIRLGPRPLLGLFRSDYPPAYAIDKSLSPHSSSCTSLTLAFCLCRVQTLLHYALQQWCQSHHCRNKRYAQGKPCYPSVAKITGLFRAVWATLITNTNYLPGLFTLEYSLRKAGSKYPLVVLYTDSFPPEGHAAVNARGLPKQRVPHLLPTLPKEYANDPRFYDTWTKLTAFSLVEYERVVLLDSDMLVRQNMDELMDLELDAPELGGRGNRVFAASHACVCNPLKKPHYPKDWYVHLAQDVQSMIGAATDRTLVQDSGQLRVYVTACQPRQGPDNRSPIRPRTWTMQLGPPRHQSVERSLR